MLHLPLAGGEVCTFVFVLPPLWLLQEKNFITIIV